MKDKDYIEELFSKTLNEHQVNVRPELWSAIQSQVAASSTTTAASIASKSLWVKGIVGISAIVVMSVGAYVYFNPTDEVVVKEQQPTEINTTATDVESSPIEEATSNAVNEQVATNKEKKQDTVEEQLIFIPPVPTEETKTTTIPPSVYVLAAKEKEQKTPVLIEKPISVTEISEPKITPPIEIKEKEPIVQNENNTDAFNKASVKSWNNTNVFTPNGDGVNDYFFLEIGKLKEFSIAVLDKNNNVVFTSEDAEFKWDGTNYLTGEKVPPGTYSYILYAVDLSGEQTRQFNLLYITK